MFNGLIEAPVIMLARDAAFTADVRPLIGVAAAALAAVLAGQASWRITDRLMSRRQGADNDDL